MFISKKKLAQAFVDGYGTWCGCCSDPTEPLLDILKSRQIVPVKLNAHEAVSFLVKKGLANEN